MSSLDKALGQCHTCIELPPPASFNLQEHDEKYTVLAEPYAKLQAQCECQEWEFQDQTIRPRRNMIIMEIVDQISNNPLGDFYPNFPITFTKRFLFVFLDFCIGFIMRSCDLIMNPKWPPSDFFTEAFQLYSLVDTQQCSLLLF